MPTRSPSLTNSAEPALYILGVVVNVFIVGAILSSYWWMQEMPAQVREGTRGQVIQYATYGLLLLIPAIIIARQVQRASILGQAVQLSREQFPDIYEVKDDYARRLRLPRNPEIYLANGNGTLNAFASSAVGRDYVVVSNELFANLYNNNREGLAFIIGHELGHIKRNHTKIWYQLSILFFSILPVLSFFLSRAREYTSDRHGAWLSPNGVDGLVLLASGRYAYQKVNVAEVLSQERQFRGVWAGLATIVRSHPLTIRRIKTLVDLGLLSPERPSDVPAVDPVTSLAQDVVARIGPMHRDHDESVERRS
jgi:Zn-dependent protease with chaperone function